MLKFYNIAWTIKTYTQANTSTARWKNESCRSQKRKSTFFQIGFSVNTPHYYKIVPFFLLFYKILADRAKSSTAKKRQGSHTKLNGTLDSDMQNGSRGSSGYRQGSGQINGSFQKNERPNYEDDDDEERRQKILNRVIFRIEDFFLKKFFKNY